TSPSRILTLRWQLCPLSAQLEPSSLRSKITTSFSAHSRSVRAVPMKPVPPVMRIRCPRGSCAGGVAPDLFVSSNMSPPFYVSVRHRMPDGVTQRVTAAGHLKFGTAPGGDRAAAQLPVG